MVQVVHIEEVRSRCANYVEIPSQLSENIKFALDRVGITRLYSHQVRDFFTGNFLDHILSYKFLCMCSTVIECAGQVN